MLKIGLTGGIATGKSTVSAYLQEQGYVVIDADIVARQVVTPDSKGLRQLVELLGDAILHNDGQLNRQRLGALIFADETRRQQVNAILHPLIFATIEQQLASLAHDAVVFIDMPLLYEVGYQGQVDQVWLVYVPQTLQLNRLMIRNHWTKAQAEQVIASQWPIEVKRQLTQYVIDNQGSRQATYQQINQLLAQL